MGTHPEEEGGQYEDVVGAHVDFAGAQDEGAGAQEDFAGAEEAGDQALQSQPEGQQATLLLAQVQ